MVASIDLSGSQRHAGEVEGTAAVTAPRTRQHEKRNLSPVYRLSIARPDSKRAIRSLPPASTSPAEQTVLHHLQKAKSWQPTQRGLAFDVTISLSAPGKEAREAPANPLPQQRLPSTSEAVWCLALNRIGDVLWWGRSFGAAGKRASNSARVGRASAANPGRNKGSIQGRLSNSSEQLQTATVWQLVANSIEKIIPPS